MYKVRLKDWGIRKNIKANEALKVASGHNENLGFWPEARSSNYDHRIARHLRNCKHGKNIREQFCQSCRAAQSASMVLDITTPAYLSKALANVEMGLYYAECYFQAEGASRLRTVQWFCTPFASQNDTFMTLFATGLENLSRNHGVEQAFADINRSFDYLKGLIEADHPSVYHNLVRRIASCKAYPGSDVCLSVCRMLARYCQQLSLVVHGTNHPINRCFAADLGMVEFGELGDFEVFLEGTRMLCGKYYGAAPGCLRIETYVPSSKRGMTAEALREEIGPLSTTTEADSGIQECRLALAELSLGDNRVDEAVELVRATLASYDCDCQPVYPFGNSLWAAEIMWRGGYCDESVKILREAADSLYMTGGSYQPVVSSSFPLDQKLILGILRYRLELLGRKEDYNKFVAESARLMNKNRELKPLQILCLTSGNYEIGL